MKGRCRKKEEEGTLQFKSAPQNALTSLPHIIIPTSSFIFFLQQFGGSNFHNSCVQLKCSCQSTRNPKILIVKTCVLLFYFDICHLFCSKIVILSKLQLLLIFLYDMYTFCLRIFVKSFVFCNSIDRLIFIFRGHLLQYITLLIV